MIIKSIWIQVGMENANYAKFYLTMIKFINQISTIIEEEKVRCRHER